MSINKMQTNIRYLVTKGSNDGTFEVGDIIKLESNGDILCYQARGWITAEDVAEAVKGMEFEVHKEHYDTLRKKLTEQLKSLPI